MAIKRRKVKRTKRVERRVYNSESGQYETVEVFEPYDEWVYDSSNDLGYSSDSSSSYDSGSSSYE